MVAKLLLFEIIHQSLAKKNIKIHIKNIFVDLFNTNSYNITNKHTYKIPRLPIIAYNNNNKG